ncbi:hypothetical protein KKH13_04740 [Patescibacteria group bacterium]|uniref:DUF7336 domain-containing protein n=1 Tax=viral metagenome TaxID=1070528 RepID=A0A6M3KQJ7_9ZZZZ|nr:hypothetical protein [Patescibacteria group bacterium]
MKVYIVAAGEYSDYHIVSVFSTKEIAERYVTILCPSGFVTEYEVDNPEDLEDLKRVPIGHFSYEATIHIDGTIHVKRINVDDMLDDYLFIRDFRFGMSTEIVMLIYCFAKDDIHATKIASERRREFLALNKWPEKEGEQYETQ